MLHFASQRDADAHVLRGQIDKLQSKKQLDSGQEATLITLQQQLSAIRSPAHAISDDVLSYIFEVGSGDGLDNSFAWTVSHVVSRWRRVAFATPRMWTNLLVNFPAKSTGSQERWMIALERSGSCPLNVIIRLYDHHVPFSYDLPKQVALRARTYYLDGKDYTGPSVALPTFTTTLTTLTLYNLSLSQNWMKDITACLSSCRALRNLSIQYVYEAGSSEEIVHTTPDVRCQIKLPALETLHLRGTHACAISIHLQAKPLYVTVAPSVFDSHGMSPLLPHILNKLSEVQSLELAQDFWTTGTITQTLAATPKLRTLTLTSVRLPYVANVDQTVTVPQLKRITVNSGYDNQLEGLKNITHMLEADVARSSLTVDLHSSRLSQGTAELMDWLKERVHAVLFSSAALIEYKQIAEFIADHSDDDI